MQKLYASPSDAPHEKTEHCASCEAYYLASEVDARIAELRDIVRQAEKDVLSSAGICLACGEIDEGDGEPEHAKDCWVPRSRELLRVL